MLKLSSLHKTQEGDPWWERVTVLLPMSGADASTTFTDLSDNGFFFTAVGDAQVDDAVTLFSENTLLLDGTGDYLTYVANAAFDLGAGAFTIELNFEADSFASAQTLYGRDEATYFITRVSSFSIMNSTTFRFYWGIRGTNEGWINFTVPTMSVDTMYHVAVCRDAAGVWYLFLDGAAATGGGTNTINLDGSTLPMYIGCWAATGAPPIEPFAGHIANFRMTKGICRYTSNFDVPAAAFPTS